MVEDTTPHPEGERTTIVAPRKLFQPGEEAYRYKLEAPTFTGVEDVDQFISEFNETLAITQWPPRVPLIKLGGGIDGTSQAVRTEIQYRRDLRSTAGPFWHHRAGSAVPLTKTTPPGRHITPRPRYHNKKNGTDRIQRPARNTTTALHLGRLHSIPQQHRPSPPAPGQRGHHYKSSTSGRRSLPPGPATLRSSTDLPTGDSAPWALTGSYHQHLPLS